MTSFEFDLTLDEVRALVGLRKNAAYWSAQAKFERALDRHEDELPSADDVCGILASAPVQADAGSSTARTGTEGPHKQEGASDAS